MGEVAASPPAYLAAKTIRARCNNDVCQHETCWMAETVVELYDLLNDIGKRLPVCMGEWVDGSGGHRKYTGGCSNTGIWDVGMGFVCDDHKSKTGGDEDAWEWENERDKLYGCLEEVLHMITDPTFKQLERLKEINGFVRMKGLGYV